MTALSIVIWFRRAFAQDRPEGLLIAFRPAHLHHPRGKTRPQGRRLIAGCAIARRPCLDPDHPTIYRWRQRRPAPTGGADLMGGRAREVAFGFASKNDRAYAINIIETVTWLAGRPDYFDELGEADEELDLFGSIGRARSSKVFEWLMTALSYQGISDAVARSYMAAHEQPAWVNIARGVNNGACPLLQSYWHFHGCGYRKAAQTCAKPRSDGDLSVAGS